MKTYHNYINMDLKSKLKFLKFIGYTCALVAVITSGDTLANTIQTLHTSESWKFYAALAGFTIFLSMLIILIMVDLALVITPEIVKHFKGKLGLT
ncbi:hypothetical protein [Mongoliitalea lutea]|uniref:Uncharacterized protein n=1 Tax=Mongoliitalea lutea TaxID=849756 RepID=A0A8J3CXB9_9BACT|nr:hypothetical protein [Mongoliitalea lutea]GHB31893.1 hypothetical protein GCM10008106_11020 [Mongoliitalea lutea]